MPTAASTTPPAKLNLFLELLGKRADGFHDIDTVMIPIDWCDQMQITPIDEPTVRISIRWLPSREQLAKRLGLKPDAEAASQILDLPDGPGNLVHQALQKFRETFGIKNGFECNLSKSIPAGAGLGGASSDAASALQCAAALTGISAKDPKLYRIAEAIGSDVPFFLGMPETHQAMAARAQGRGEQLQSIPMAGPLDFVVAYPAVCLSTAKVYTNSQIPQNPQDASSIMKTLETGQSGALGKLISNRLTDAAKKLAPQIEEILESMWRVDPRPCQLTGSGSACFAIASSKDDALQYSERLRAQIEPGAIVMPVRSTQVPALVKLT